MYLHNYYYYLYMLSQIIHHAKNMVVSTNNIYSCWKLS